MTRQQHLLLLLMEECDETSQRASKAIRFTLEEVQPGQSLSNEQRLIQEFSDLMAVMQLLVEEGHLKKMIDPKQILRKKAKIERFIKHSRKQGTVL